MMSWHGKWVDRHGVVTIVLNGNIILSEFELKLNYHIHSRTNSLGEMYESSYLSSYGLNSTTIVLLQG